MVVDCDEVLLVVAGVAVAVDQDAVLVAAPAVAAVVPRSPFRLSIRLSIRLLVVVVVEEEDEEQEEVVLVVVANSIHRRHFAGGVGSIRCFVAAVAVPLQRSDSELVLPHSVHPMHLVLLPPQVSVFLETVMYTSDC